jgi:hypothetical protein
MEREPRQLELDGATSLGGNDVRPPAVTLGGRPINVSTVFWTYWKFAAERQAIFFRRLHDPLPWTLDSILQRFRFTNAYRASDRVSQYMIRNVAYKGDKEPSEIFFRVILFKLFNKIDTWELLEKNVGPISSHSYRFDVYDSILTRALENGQKIYSAAYIMPSGGKGNGGRKHRFHLQVLEQMMRDEVPSRIADMKLMADGFDLLRSYPGIGDFLAYQFITDLNYSDLCAFDEMEFVVAGPGAKDGIRKCFPDANMKSAADVIRMVAEAQDEYFSAIGLSFLDLWGRRLQLIDCQNLFCEVDKYSRCAHPEIAGISGRSRIKQKYHPSENPLQLFYPPKWGINSIIPNHLRAA